MKKRIWVFGILSILLFLLPRLHNLSSEINFGSDQGLQLLEIYRRYTEKDFTLIGPYLSFQVEGKSFFFGPLSYYLPIPWMVIFNWKPLSASYFMIFLQAGALLFSVWILRKADIKWKIIFLYMFFFSTFPLIVYYGRFFWNPNFHIPIASVLVCCVYYWIKKKKDISLILIGVLFGLGMQPHFAFVLSILLSVGILLKQKIPFKKWILVLGGFFPWMWFELRHSFYNTKTMIGYFFTSATKISSGFQEYYLLCLIPFFILFLSFLFTRENIKFKKDRGLIFIAVAILYTLILLNFHTPIGIIDKWNFNGLSAIYSIILIDHPKKSYNIVDLLTGDTRAMSLRYLLTIANNLLKEVDQYPYSTSIYLYTRVPIKEVEMGTLWELDGIRPFKIVHQWNIQNDVVLYKLEKG